MRVQPGLHTKRRRPRRESKAALNHTTVKTQYKSIVENPHHGGQKINHNRHRALASPGLNRSNAADSRPPRTRTASDFQQTNRPAIAPRPVRSAFALFAQLCRKPTTYRVPMSASVLHARPWQQQTRTLSLIYRRLKKQHDKTRPPPTK